MSAFWLTKTPEEMSDSEWESLCDSCGLCCLIRLEDEDTGAQALSRVSCKYLDHNTCACTDYANRQANVPDCLKITVEAAKTNTWLPETCGYRRVTLGKDLPDWHHLKCGDKNRVHEEGISLQGQMVCESTLKNDDELFQRQEELIVEIREPE